MSHVLLVVSSRFLEGKITVTMKDLVESQITGIANNFGMA